MAILTVKGQALFEERVVYAVIMVTAVIGGLSLLVSITAPFNIAMSHWTSFFDVMLTAAVCGSCARRTLPCVNGCA